MPPSDTAEPLTVVFTLLSRPDSAPLSERRKADGSMLDKGGRPIGDPAANPGDNAFEEDPNLNFEKWNEYWRKVHGGRFVHPEGDESTVEKLLRYDQVQRLPAGPTSFWAPPYPVPLDGEGRMFPTAIGHIPPHRRPRWDGAAYLFFNQTDDIAAVFSSSRVQEKILPEERVMFRDLAPLLARQHVIIPSGTTRDAITLVVTHARHPCLDRVTFQARWLMEHADIVLAQPDTQRFIKRYVQLHNVGPTVEGEPFYHPDTSQIDGVSLFAFSSMNDVEDFLQTSSFQAIRDDEAQLCRLADSEFWTALNITVVNRIGPDQKTKRSGVF